MKKYVHSFARKYARNFPEIVILKQKIKTRLIVKNCLFQSTEKESLDRSQKQKTKEIP